MPVYPEAFTLWQGFDIAALIAIAIYTAIMPDFVMAPLSYVYWLGEILIGIACIIIVRRKPAPEHRHDATRTAPAAYSVAARIIFAFLGVLIGGFIGFWLGLGIGIAIAEATNMSSFEGASGYFAVFIGLAGVLRRRHHRPRAGALLDAPQETRRHQPLSRATSASSSAIRWSRRCQRRARRRRRRSAAGYAASNSRPRRVTVNRITCSGRAL